MGSHGREEVNGPIDTGELAYDPTDAFLFPSNESRPPPAFVALALRSGLARPRVVAGRRSRRTMDARIPGEVTKLLRRVGSTDRAALDELLPVVYRELHVLAQAKLRGQAPGHTLQPTALVNEAYLRLARQRGKAWKDSKHFYRAAANAMRCILINHARDRQRDTRGGGAVRVPLDEQLLVFEEKAIDLLDLEDALRRLEERDARQVDVVELRFFAGLTVKETADVLGVSARTVEDDWSFARAWLLRELSRGAGQDDGRE